MSRRSRAAVARSVGGQRFATVLVGLLLLAAGVLALVLSLGVFGVYRAQRPVVDPIALDWMAANPTPARWILLGVGVVLFVLGLMWAVRALRPEPRPDVLLSESPGQRLTVEHQAISDAVRRDAESIDGVSRARVRLVGDARRPALRLTLFLSEGTDVREVWAEVDGRVLARARQAFDVSALPTAVRVELDSSSTSTPRVS